MEDITNFVAGDGIKTTTEADQLNHLNIILSCGPTGCIIHAGMISPLVEYFAFTFLGQVGNRILGKDSGVVLQKQSIDAMVDLSINVIRPAYEHDDRPVSRAGIADNELSLAPDGALVGRKGRKTIGACLSYLRAAKQIMFIENLV